jgi:hypothetical protein
MAKTATKEKMAVSETTPATIPEAPATNLVPGFLGEYTGPLGTENIDSSDVNIPRLKLGQSMTPEVKDRVVNDGDLFHSITKQVLIPVGKAGLVIPVAYVKEYVLWRDRQDGGGIFARARRTQVRDEIRYAWDKPNSTFEHKIKGAIKVTWRTKTFIEEDGLDKFGSAIPGDRDSSPAATAHFNYIICLPDHDYEMVAISLNRSSAKKAKDWNAMLKMGHVPMFARQFNLSAVSDQNDAGDKFYNYSITPAGFVQSQEIFNQLRTLHEELGQSTLTVDWSDEEAARHSGGDAPEKF